MSKKIIVSIFLLVIIFVGFYVFTKNNTKPIVQENNNGSVPLAFDPRNATYVIEGRAVTLIDGKAESESAPGSASKITSMFFGEPVLGDLNNDSRSDAAVFLVQNSGGSGTFYYAVAAINTGDGAHGTNAVLLGDRVAPQTIEIKNGQIIANFAERAPGEPMTVAPSVGVSKYLSYDGSVLRVASAIVGVGEHCGGNMTTAPTCASGYHCAPDPKSRLPFGDVGGICVSD